MIDVLPDTVSHLSVLGTGTRNTLVCEWSVNGFGGMDTGLLPHGYVYDKLEYFAQYYTTKQPLKSHCALLKWKCYIQFFLINFFTPIIIHPNIKTKTRCVWNTIKVLNPAVYFFSIFGWCSSIFSFSSNCIFISYQITFFLHGWLQQEKKCCQTHWQHYLFSRVFCIPSE